MQKKRFKRDKLFKIQHHLRSYIANSLRRYLKINTKISKQEKSIVLLGCSLKFFKNYIQKRFKK